MQSSSSLSPKPKRSSASRRRSKKSKPSSLKPLSKRKAKPKAKPKPSRSSSSKSLSRSESRSNGRFSASKSKSKFSSTSSSKSSKRKRLSQSRSKGKAAISRATDAVSIAITVALISSVIVRSTSSTDAKLTTPSFSSAIESDIIRAAQDMPAAKIVGGETAPQGRYSYPLALAVGGSFCGGSLITPDTVLTAAHCVTKAPGGPCDVAKGIAIIGATNIMYPKGHHEIMKLQSCSVHPHYKRTPEGLVAFDVALVKLEKTSKYPPVWLDNGKKALKAHDQLTVMGWGRTNQYSKGISPSLMRVGTKYVSEEKCNGITQGAVGDSHLCCWAGSKIRESPYSGDSGGPLVVENLGNVRNQDIQVGIVSMVMGSLNPEFPAIYTRVAVVAEWIKENTNGVKFASVDQAKKPSGAGLPASSVGGNIALITVAALVGFVGGTGGQEVRYRMRDRRERAEQEVNGLRPPAREELEEEMEENERDTAKGEAKYEFAEGEI